MNPRTLTMAVLLTAAACQAQLFQNLSNLAERIPVGSGSGVIGREDGPKWLCTGDFDADGKADIATTHINGEISIIWGYGNKRFTAPTVKASGMKTLRGIASADFNSDGKPDLVAAAPEEGVVVIWRNMGGRQFFAPTTVATFRGARNLAVGNFDGDPYPDIAVAGPNRVVSSGVIQPATPPALTGLIQLKGSANGVFARVKTVPEVGSASDPYAPYRPLYTVHAFRVPGDTVDRVAVTHAESKKVWTLKPVEGLLTVESTVATVPATAETNGGVRAIKTGSVTAAGGTACDLLTANSETGDIQIRKRRIFPGGAFGWEDTPWQTLKIPFGPRSMELHDLDLDGWPDLVVAVRNAARVIVFKNKNGVFEQSSSATCGRSPREMATADFNSDGYVDFAVVNRESYDVSILAGGPPRADGIASFSALDQVYAVDGEPAALKIVNVNGDSRGDVIQLHRASGEISVRMSGTGGVLGAPVFYKMGTTPNAMTIIDFDRDGMLDLVTGNLGNSITSGATGYRKGLGNGTFGPYVELKVNEELAALGINLRTTTGLYDIAYGDLDNDGISDAVAGFLDCTILLYKGLPNGTFRLVTPGSGLDHIFTQFIFEARAFSIADFDQDGDNDIAAIGVYGELGTVENKGDLLKNNRQPLVIRKTGLLQQISDAGWSGAGRSLVLRDVNNDGDPDLIAGVRAGSVVFYGSSGINFVPGERWHESAAPPRNFSAPVVDFPVSSLAQGDFDGNGVDDLAIACSVAGCVEIQTRNSFGGWDRALRVAAPSASCLASGDIDGDGKPDLAGTGEVLWVALSSRPAAAGPPVVQTFARATLSRPVINEIMAQNATVAVTGPNLTVDAADNPDYIEIYNGGATSTDFSGWKLTLTGTGGGTKEFTFPSTAVTKEGGRLLVRCSGQQTGVIRPDPWRTGWGLPESGGTLVLKDANGSVVDSVVYPKQLRDVSYGRYLDGLDSFVFNGLPDPGRPNVDNGPLAPRIDFDGFTTSTYGPNKNTVFHCECRDDAAPISCTIVYWRTDIDDPTRYRVLLYDDGMHEDGGSLDSHWAGRMPMALPDGAHIAFYIEATDLSDAVAYDPVEPTSLSDDDSGAGGFYRLAITTPVPSLEISEVVTRNKRVHIDGSTPDYFEIRNTGSTPVTMTGIRLTGKLFEAAPGYTFPAGTALAPGTSTLVHADGYNGLGVLDPAGGTFYLVRGAADPLTQGNGFLDKVTVPALEKSEAWHRLGPRGPWTRGPATPRAGNVRPGTIVLAGATGESGETMLMIAVPTQAGVNWQIQHSTDLRQWSTYLSGTGTGFEQAVPLPVGGPQGYFRGASP